MDRTATVRWRTPPPTSIDEELAVYDDGTAWLITRRPRGDAPEVGTYRCELAEGEGQRLAAHGPQPLGVDLLHPATDGDVAEIAVVAGRVAERARSQPYAVARFVGQPLPGGVGGALSIALAVVGEGVEPVAFELDAAGSAVHFLAGGSAVSWIALPPPATGFVTAEAEGLGGLQRRAAVRPAQSGVLAVDVVAPDGVGEVSIQVAGWLVEALPDAPERQRFEVRTTPAAVLSG